MQSRLRTSTLKRGELAVTVCINPAWEGDGEWGRTDVYQTLQILLASLVPVTTVGTDSGV